MFSQLKGVVDLIRTGINEFRQFKSAQERKEVILGVLEVYFLLKDCVDDGEELIRQAGNDPVGRIKAMKPDEARETLKRWDSVLRKQGMRLYRLGGCIFGQDHLAVINPDLQEEISKVVGNKMDRVVTLHGIGAGLFFRNIFPIKEPDEEKAELVAVMAGVEKDSVLDSEKIGAEVAALRESLEEYRAVVERVATNEELLSLSREAREKTLYKDPA